MFEGKQFYHSTHRKIVIAFGTLFNSIYINRNTKDIKVPLSFAPRQHFIAKLMSKANDEKINQSLPIMSFDIEFPEYNSDRETDNLQTVCSLDDNGNIKQYFQPVSYTFPVTLNIWAKYMDDKYQIIEQILPYFRPDFVLQFNTLKGLVEQENLNIKFLGGNDNSGGNELLVDKSIINAQLNFEVEAKLYPIVEDGTLIRRAIVNMTDKDIVDNDASTVTATLNPFLANPDDEFSVDIEYTN